SARRHNSLQSLRLFCCSRVDASRHRENRARPGWHPGTTDLRRLANCRRLELWHTYSVPRSMPCTSEMSTKQRRGILLFSPIGGLGLIFAGFHYSALNWVVDGSGWIVSRFFSVDFHEGEGAFGFLLGLALSWAFASFLVFAVVLCVLKIGPLM